MAVFNSNERRPKKGEIVKILSLDRSDAHTGSPHQNKIINNRFVIIGIWTVTTEIASLKNDDTHTIMLGFTYELSELFEEKKIEDI